MKNQITMEQIQELINLRLNTLNMESYTWNISELNDPIISWYLTIRERKLLKN
jgi:hypothetical protein